MNYRILFLAAAVALLSGCTLGFEATFEDLSLVREEPPDIVAQYSLSGRKEPKRPLAGRLRLDFATDIDLIALEINEGYYIRYDGNICNSETSIGAWGILYENKNVSLAKNDDFFHYSIFLEPNWRYEYDLKQKSHSICIQFRAVKMVTLFDYRSNNLVIEREQVIRAFEERP